MTDIKYDKTKYGIPYMGSKKKLAKKIVDYIVENNPNMKYFYDLFGGGGAISFEMLKRPGIKVIYNEFDPAMVNLIKKIRDYGVTEEFYQWIDIDEFKKYKNGDDWFSGMVKTCWSFGNRGRTYLYGKNIEHYKKLIHNVVVNKCQKSADELNEHFKTSINVEDIEGETLNERRLFLQRFFTKTVNNKEIFRGIFCIEKGNISNILQHLERLQHLECLQHLELLKHLELFNKSYDEVIVDTPTNETIIYCDPPYKNTGKYQNNIDHNRFDEWVENNPCKVYVSEYNSKFNEVMTWRTRSTMSATNNKKTTEKLYCNRKELQKRKTMELF
jgi:site-specific DNA-adenine methylase